MNCGFKKGGTSLVDLFVCGKHRRLKRPKFTTCAVPWPDVGFSQIAFTLFIHKANVIQLGTTGEKVVL